MRLALLISLQIFCKPSSATLNFRLDLTDVSHGGTQVYDQLTRLFQELDQLQSHSGNNVARMGELTRNIQRLTTNVGPHFTVNGHRYGLFDARAWRNAPGLSDTVLKELLEDGRTRQELRNLMRSNPSLFRNSIFGTLGPFLEKFPERSNPPRNAIKRALISVVTLMARGGAAFGNYTGLTRLAGVVGRTGAVLSRTAAARLTATVGGRALNIVLNNPYLMAVNEVLLNPPAFGNPDPHHGEACIESLQERIGRLVTLKRVIAEYRCQSVSQTHCGTNISNAARADLNRMVQSREATFQRIRRTLNPGNSGEFYCPFYGEAARRLGSVVRELDGYDFGEECNRQNGMLVQSEYDENPCEGEDAGAARTSLATH